MGRTDRAVFGQETEPPLERSIPVLVLFEQAHGGQGIEQERDAAKVGVHLIAESFAVAGFPARCKKRFNSAAVRRIRLSMNCRASFRMDWGVS